MSGHFAGKKIAVSVNYLDPVVLFTLNLRVVRLITDLGSLWRGSLTNPNFSIVATYIIFVCSSSKY